MKDLRKLCENAIWLWDADCDMVGVIDEMRTALAQTEPEGVDTDPDPADHSNLYLPDWATGTTTAWCVGAQLCTKDGRRLGNAVIASYHQGELSPWEMVTDAGTTLRLNEAELDELFWPPSWVMNVASSPGIRARAALAQPEPSHAELVEITETLARHTSRQDLADLAEVAIMRVRCACPTIEPVPVTERLPEPGKKVLAYHLNALGEPKTIIAEWVPAKTRKDSPEGDIGKYDCETDQFYWPEGWYEQIENWEGLEALLVDEGEITHWRPLPRGPHHSLPVPTTH